MQCAFLRKNAWRILSQLVLFDFLCQNGGDQRALWWGPNATQRNASKANTPGSHMASVHMYEYTRWELAVVSFTDLTHTITIFSGLDDNTHLTTLAVY